MELPRNWTEITIRTYLQLRECNAEEFDGVTSFMIEILSILSGEDFEVIESLPTRKIKELFESVDFIQKLPSIKTVKKIKINDLELTHKSKGITLGEYIDLIQWNEGEINAPLMLATLYRRTKADEWGNPIFEPRDYDLQERGNLFLDLNVSECWGVIEDFRKFNLELREKNKDLFQGDDPEEKDEDEEQNEEVTRRTTASVKNEAIKKAMKRHEWLKLVHDLCGEDITKKDEVLKTSVNYVFNVLAMKSDLKGVD